MVGHVGSPRFALAKCCWADEKDFEGPSSSSGSGLLCQTAEELYALIPNALPTECQFIRAAAPHEMYNAASGDDAKGVYKILDLPFLRALPPWNWLDMYHFFSNGDEEEVEC